MNRIVLFLFALLVLLGCSKTRKGTSGQGGTTTDAGGLELFRQDDRFGYKDLSGELAIKPRFAEAGGFSEGLARVRPDPQGSWGYINSSGDEAISAQFEGASDFLNGKAVVQKNEKFLYIGPDGSSLGFFEDSPVYRPLSAGDTLYVIHPNGLIARGQGDVNSDAVGNVQFGEPVEYVYDPHQRQYQSVEGLRGAWLSVKFQEKRGYLFDVFLSRFPQADEKRAVETYKVVVSGANNQTYSTYTLTKYMSGGRLNTHEGFDWAESQEIVPASDVEQVIAKMKLFPSGVIGSVIDQFNGEPGSFTTQNGEHVVINVRRDSGGFLEEVTVSRKSDEENLEISISRYNIHDVEIVTSSTSTQSEDANQ